MERWIGKVALVTGVSTGIGKEIVKTLLSSKMIVVGCSRRQAALDEVREEFGSPENLKLIVCDVSKESDVSAMFEEIKTQYGGLDVCINNAGVALHAPILSGESHFWQQMFDINVMGLLRVSREAVKSMKMKSIAEGHVINICSMAGHQVGNNPGTHVYAASKHAVTAISHGLRHELLAEQPDFICRVSQISPGLVETPMTEPKPGQSALPFKQGVKMMDVENIADTVIYMLSLPAHAQVQDVLIKPTNQRL